MRYNHERGRWEINKKNPLDWFRAAFVADIWEHATGVSDIRDEALSREVARQYIDPADRSPFAWHRAQIRSLKDHGLNREARMATEALGILERESSPADYQTHSASQATPKRQKSRPNPEKPSLSDLIDSFEGIAGNKKTETEELEDEWQKLIEEVRAFDNANGFNQN